MRASKKAIADEIERIAQQADERRATESVKNRSPEFYFIQGLKSHPDFVNIDGVTAVDQIETCCGRHFLDREDLFGGHDMRRLISCKWDTVKYPEAEMVIRLAERRAKDTPLLPKLAIGNRYIEDVWPKYLSLMGWLQKINPDRAVFLAGRIGAQLLHVDRGVISTLASAAVRLGYMSEVSRPSHQSAATYCFDVSQWDWNTGEQIFVRSDRPPVTVQRYDPLPESQDSAQNSQIATIDESESSRRAIKVPTPISSVSAQNRKITAIGSNGFNGPKGPKGENGPFSLHFSESEKAEKANPSPVAEGVIDEAEENRQWEARKLVFKLCVHMTILGHGTDSAFHREYRRLKDNRVSDTDQLLALQDFIQRLPGDDVCIEAREDRS